MRTQDLDRFEQLAHRLAAEEALPEEEVVDILGATGRTWDDLRARADFHRWRRSAAPRRMSPLESYQQETKVLGVHEGMVVVWTPILILALATVLLVGVVLLLVS